MENNVKKIKLYLDYKCFPLWIYDENDVLVDNDLVEELATNVEIESELVKIQEEYDNLFMDSEKEFSFLGFKDKYQKEAFVSRVKEIHTKIKRVVGEYYIVEDVVDIDNI